MKHIIVTNMNVPLYSWPLAFWKEVGNRFEGRWQF